MAELKWDAEVDRVYETGVKRGVLYPKNGTTYDKGVAWNGLTSVSESPSGAEETALYADDMKYLSLRSAEEFGATIEAYTYPDEWAACDGSAALDENGGVLVGQQVRKGFGMCYRTTVGNAAVGESYGYKLHIIYNAMASPSQKSYSTINDSPEAITFSWEIKTTPIPFGGTLKPSATLTIDSTKCDPAILARIEAKLYGTDGSGAGSTGTDPTLPGPEWILALFDDDENTPAD